MCCDGDGIALRNMLQSHTILSFHGFVRKVAILIFQREFGLTGRGDKDTIAVCQNFF